VIGVCHFPKLVPKLTQVGAFVNGGIVMIYDARKLGILFGLILVWLHLIVLSQPALSVAVNVVQHRPTATELHVCPSGCDYASIQAAVDAASSGDTIKIATGIYTDTHVRPRADITTTGTVTQIVHISKTVTLQGGYSPTDWAVSHPLTQPSILDAEAKGRVVYVTGAISPVLEGLYVTGGNADAMYAPWYDSAGSGIYAISATITVSASHVYGNAGADKGAGIGVRYGSLLLSGSTITGNTSSQYGGGLFLYFSEGMLKNNTISGNTGFCCAGGGAYLQYSNASFIANMIFDNWAGYAGGGVEIFGGTVRLTNTIISDNTAWIIGPFGSPGGGIRSTNANLHLIHDTIAQNVGEDEGVSVDGGQAIFINTIISHDAPAYLDFVDPATGNYHIGLNSTARDSGVDAGVTEDIDGDPRPDGCGFDVGADESSTGIFCNHHIYLVVVLKN
jgi:parallel beta-helix repeat protein